MTKTLVLSEEDYYALCECVEMRVKTFTTARGYCKTVALPDLAKMADAELARVARLRDTLATAGLS